MPPQTHSDPAPEAQQPSRPSRRSLLRGAAGAGAVGLVAAGGAGAVAGLTRPAAAAVPSGAAAVPPGALQGPVMVYLRDAKTGEMDVFAGTGQVSLRDPALAGQLLRAIQ